MKATYQVFVEIEFDHTFDEDDRHHGVSHKTVDDALYDLVDDLCGDNCWKIKDWEVK